MGTIDIPGLRGFVARSLLGNQDTGSKDLFALALGRYPAVGELTVQQFHGRYVLPVRRELKRRPLQRPRFPTVPETFESGELSPSPPPSTPERSPALNGRAEGRPSGPGLSLLERLAGAGAEQGESRVTTQSATTTVPPEPQVIEEPEPVTVAEPATPLVEQAKAVVPEEESRADPLGVTRTLFFQLALEIEMAETASELVDVIAGIDRYVDRAVAAARP